MAHAWDSLIGVDARPPVSMTGTWHQRRPHMGLKACPGGWQCRADSHIRPTVCGRARGEAGAGQGMRA